MTDRSASTRVAGNGSGHAPAETAGHHARRPLGKIPYLETVRGLACVLLVAFHVVGSTPTEGLRLATDHWLATANSAFADMRMPLFSLISGIVFASAVSSKREWLDKVARKARRLLLPMITVGTLHYFVQFAVGEGSSRSLWMIYVLPFEHFWFLQATFLLMIALLTAELLLHDAARAAPLAAAFCAAVFLLVPPWAPEFFSSYRAIYLGSFFYLGVAVARYVPLQSNVLDRPLLRLAALACAMFSLVLIWAQLTGRMAEPFEDLAGIAVSYSVIFGVLSWKPTSRALIWIGGASYGIYLFHVFFTAGSRIVLRGMFNNLPAELLFVAGLVAGVIGPIILTRLLLIRPETALLFLGIDRRTRPASG